MVHINVRYKPNLRQSVWLNLYLRRKSIWTGVILGTWAIVLGVAVIGHMPPEVAVILIAIGVVIIPEIPVLVWLQVYRNRRVILNEVEVTLTSEGIERRTDTATIHVTWDKLEQIRELNGMWVFVANRLTRFGLAKRVLSRDQQVELAAFIAERAT